MRAKWLVGIAAIAVAAPLCAQADNAAVFDTPDLWYSGPGRADFKSPDIAWTSPDIARTQATAALPSLRASGALPRDLIASPRDTVSPAVRTMPISRVMTSPAVLAPAAAMAPSTAATQAAAPQAATSAPEMNSGLAATGLTLLLGGVSVLRSRRTGSRA